MSQEHRSANVSYTARKAVLVSLFAVGSVLIVGSVGLTAGASAPGSPVQSRGCAIVNDPFLDNIYQAATSNGTFQFFAGDTIVVTAGGPASAPPPDTLTLVVGTSTGATPFPGSITFTFPADANVAFSWSVGPSLAASATFTVSCTPSTTVGAVCIHTDLDFRAPYENGTCPSGYRAASLGLVPIGGTPVCVTVKTDWRAPYANGTCPSGETLFRFATVPSGGEVGCIKTKTDVRAPDKTGACPSGFTAVRFATA